MVVEPAEPIRMETRPCSQSWGLWTMTADGVVCLACMIAHVLGPRTSSVEQEFRKPQQT